MNVFQNDLLSSISLGKGGFISESSSSCTLFWLVYLTWAERRRVPQDVLYAMSSKNLALGNRVVQGDAIWVFVVDNSVSANVPTLRNVTECCTSQICKVWTIGMKMVDLLVRHFMSNIFRDAVDFWVELKAFV